MDKLKLKWRVFASLLAFCAFLLLLLWLFQTVFLRDMYKIIRQSEIKSAIKYVEQNIDSSDFQSILHEIQASKDIMVLPSKEFSPPARPQGNQFGKPQPETLTQTKEFMRSDGHRISLTFYAMITPVDATVSTLKLQLYIITAIILLLSGFLAILLSRWISSPIEEINKSAKILAAGSYDTYFSAHGFLEIKELSDTLNTAASELSKVDRLRQDLIANISHDLRTPLALIYSYAEMMHDFPDEITPEQTQIIMDETNRLSTLVNDVLDVSKLESGNMQLDERIYNLTNSLYNTINRLSKLVEKEGYQITFIQDTEIYIKADEVKITQVFYNLLLNAITHGGPDKRITVCQSIDKGFVKIEIMDNGIGINPEDIPYIWDRYYKIDKPHKRALTGTGLGLSIVKKIILLHKGICGVESDLKTGSTFWFSLKLENAVLLK